MSKIPIRVCFKGLHMNMFKIFIHLDKHLEFPYPYEKEMNQDTANVLSSHLLITW